MIMLPLKALKAIDLEAEQARSMLGRRYQPATQLPPVNRNKLCLVQLQQLILPGLLQHPDCVCSCADADWRAH